MYGSNFCIVTRKPLACSNFANEAEIIPLPKDEVTPPVTKTYFAIVSHIFCARTCNIHCIHYGVQRYKIIPVNPQIFRNPTGFLCAVKN